MGGFGLGPFGEGAFGEWYWSLFNFIENIPDVYKQQDAGVGGGALRAFLESIAPSMDNIRQKIRDYDDLRDPLRCPSERDFLRVVTILQSENLGDGTSRVYISAGADGDKFDKLHPGMVLFDFRRFRYTICTIVSAARATDVEDPPVDPATGETISKHLIVQNIGQGNTEFVPYVTGDEVSLEDPALVVPVDDGLNVGPYTVTVQTPPMVRNRVTVNWTEGGGANLRSGFFTNAGLPAGDLVGQSEIDFDTGVFLLDTGTSVPIDADSIRVTYTRIQTIDENPGDVVPADDGINQGPYVVTVAESIFQTVVIVDWTDGGGVNTRQGFFTATGSTLGDLVGTSSIDFAAGSFVLDTGNTTPIDADSIRVTYTGTDDGQIRIQNILAFLASDYGITLDRDDPEELQRSYVYNAYQLWNLKGTEDGYEVLGKIAGYAVDAQPLHKVDEDIAVDLPATDVFEFPPGSGDFFTSVEPRKPQFDEIDLDVMPLDLLCSEDDYPSVTQSVVLDASGIELLETLGSRKRHRVTVTTTAIVDSYFTAGTFVDFAGVDFEVLDPVRVDSSTYQFEVLNFANPVAGAGTVEWKVLKRDLAVGGGEITDLGFVTSGFTGKKYLIETAVADPIVGAVGNWRFIDADGNIAVIESWDPSTGSLYNIVVVSDVEPVPGAARFFYDCEIVTDCTFCRASSILVRISPSSILLFSDSPEAIEGDALDRLIIRLQQMVPAHVRIAAFVFDPGPALAVWGPIVATSTSSSPTASTAWFVPTFDIPDFPADSTPLDTSPIVATSTSTVTNENVLEEYIGGSDPLVAGTWTASSLWQVTEYRWSTQFRSFNFGQNDVGRVGDVGSVAPDYDTGGIVGGVLTSPTVSAIAAATTVTLRFRHFADIRSGGADDIVSVRVVEVGPTVLRTITKTDMGIFATGSTGGVFVTQSFDITSDVVGMGNFYLEFSFVSGTSTAGVTGEGWYIDDVEVQLTP